MTPRVREILSWYGGENIGVLTNLARLLGAGRLRGTGKLMLLSADQGLLANPCEAFSMNPDSYDPAYALETAIQAGASGFMAPRGALEAILRDYAGEMPCFLQWESSPRDISAMAVSQRGVSAIDSVKAKIKEAHRLGCVGVAVDFYVNTLDPSEGHGAPWTEGLEALAEAKAQGLVGLARLVLSRGTLNRADQNESIASPLDRVAHWAHGLCQGGATILVLPEPTAEGMSETAVASYQKAGIKYNLLAERSRHLLHSCFNGRRLVLYADGALRGVDQLVEHTNSLAKGGGFGSVLRENAFQRPKKEALQLMGEMMDALGGYNTGRNMR